MTMEQDNPQIAELVPKPASAKAIAKEVLAGITNTAIPHGEAVTSLEHLAQLRGAMFSTTEGIALASSAWTTANAALYVPVAVRHTLTIKQLRHVNGATAGDDFDLGIYDSNSEGLPAKLLVSTGQTLSSGASQVQSTNVASTVLTSGLYYLACVFDGTTSTVISFVTVAAATFTGDAITSEDGVFEELSALPLPATATPTPLTVDRRTPIVYAGRHQF